MNHGKVAKQATDMMSEANNAARKVSAANGGRTCERAAYFKSREVHKQRLKETLWPERHHKKVFSRHRRQSRYLPGVILQNTEQDVYVMQMGNSKAVERDHGQLLPQRLARTGSPWLCHCRRVHRRQLGV